MQTAFLMQKALWNLVVLLCCCFLMRSAHADDAQIRQIRRWYAWIEANKKQMQQTSAEEWGDSIGEMWRHRGQLWLVSVGGCAGSACNEQKYYFWNNQLVFVFDVKNIAPGGSKRARPVENRFYFHNGKMIRWLASGKKAVSRSNVKYRHLESQFLRTGDFWLRAARSSDPFRDLSGGFCRF